MRGERVEIDCLVRFLFVPEARRNKISGKGIFSRLTSTVYPPHEKCTRMADETDVGKIQTEKEK